MDADAPETIYRARTRRPCAEVALVLEAVGIRPSLFDLGGSWIVVVPAHDATRARREIEAWRAENVVRPHAPPPVPVADARAGVVGYVALLFAVALAAGNFIAGHDWFMAGRVDGLAMRSGEWWRAVTALTLHRDLEHLLANLFFGSVFGWFAGRYLGSGVAWLAIVAAGAAGNVLNVLTVGVGHRAIGASTAVFAALGLLGAWVWSGRRGAAGWVYRWGPVVAAVALLAYTGTGDENTDVGAHLWGFVAGLGAGVLLARVAPRRLGSRRLQIAAGLLCLALVVCAWLVALAAGTRS